MCMKRIHLRIKECYKPCYKKEIDGIRGENTDQAIYDFLFKNSSQIDYEQWIDWNAKRKTIASFQLLCIENH